jgi:hypothetical protein
MLVVFRAVASLMLVLLHSALVESDHIAINGSCSVHFDCHPNVCEGAGPNNHGTCQLGTNCTVDFDCINPLKCNETTNTCVHPPFCPGTCGDPHFSTWQGEHYEYHGECDLELASDPTFANGKGLLVNIRTEIVRTWSYIKNAAIRIDNDIIEVEGGAGENRYWFNKVYQGELTTIGGFPVKYSKASSKQRLFKIDLGDGEQIQIRTYKEFVRIDFKEPKKHLYGNTVGLLADFNSGKKLARDGVNVVEDYNEFGQEWQVLPGGPKLFHEDAGPQSPDRCILPSALNAEEKRRRLGEATVTEIDAELACAKVPVEDRNACVADVLATDDIDMVGAY